MAVQILVSLGGGGGTDTLEEFVDTLNMTKGPVDEDIHPVDAPAMTYYSSMSDGIAIDKGTPAARGALILPTLDGWWDGAAYSGSGNFLNAGTKGAAWDLILGAGGAAPSFAAGVFTFDGTDDYMRILDIDSLDLADLESLTLGIVCTPTSTTAGRAMISKFLGTGTRGYTLQIGSSTTFNMMVNEAGTDHQTAGISTASAVKALHAGTYNRQAPLIISAHRSVGGTLTSSAGTALPTTKGAVLNANNFTIGIRSDLSGSTAQAMTVNAIFMAKRSLSTIDLTAIAAYYGV